MLLADRGYDPTLGARPLRRAIQRLSRTRCPSGSSRRSSAPARSSSSTPSPTPRRGEQDIVFRAVEGFEPPPMELAEAGPAE